MKNIYKIFMERAIKLAKNGLHFISNTPIFGYVIVKNHLIIAENWKKINEENYIDNHIIENIYLLKKSTIYLTLEPNFYYKKISFIDFILKYKIPKVVIGMRNPCNINNGLGIMLLKLSGVKVIENILQNECYEINKRIFTFYKKKRPFIILKWTQSLNGIICNNIRKKNTKYFYKQLIDKWRTEEEAVLLDSKNIIYNNSLLKYQYCYNWYGKKPIIIILDKKLIIPDNYFIYNNHNKIIIITEQKKTIYNNNIIFITLKFDKNLSNKITYELYKMNIKSLIIEDSKKIIEIFVKKQNWDEAKIFIHDIYLNKGITSPKIIGNIFNKISFFNERIIFIASKEKIILK